MVWITILMKWCVIILVHIGGKMNKEEIESKCWLKRNWEPILAISAIIISIVSGVWSIKVSTDANEIAKITSYNQEHEAEISAGKIENNTCIETIIFVYPGVENNRIENINIRLHNYMSEGLKDVEYDIGAPNNTNIQNISYSSYYKGSQNALEKNYSIFVWERAIKVDDIMELSFNLTWNINDVSLDFIDHENIFFRHYSGDYPITKVENKTFWNHTELETYFTSKRYGCQS